MEFSKHDQIPADSRPLSPDGSDLEAVPTSETKGDIFADIRKYYPGAKDWALEQANRMLEDLMDTYGVTLEQAVKLNKILTGEISPSQSAVASFQDVIKLMDIPYEERTGTLSNTTRLKVWSTVLRISERLGAPIVSL